MRIDSNQSGRTVSEGNRPSASARRARSNAAAGGGPSEKLSVNEDQAQFSGAHVLLQALVAEASRLPEVRQEKVSALRQAVQRGAYRPDPEQVAGALFSYLGVSSPGAWIETDWRASQQWAVAM